MYSQVYTCLSVCIYTYIYNSIPKPTRAMVRGGSLRPGWKRCTYIYIYKTYIYTRTYIYILCIHKCIHVYLYVYIHTYIIKNLNQPGPWSGVDCCGQAGRGAHIFLYIKHTYIHGHIYIYIMYSQVYTCLSVCIYTYIYN